MHFAIPGYYTRLEAQAPTRPGWYFCICHDRRLTHLYWKDSAFWDGPQAVEVSYWVELPPFIEAVLSQTETPATRPAISAVSGADSVANLEQWPATEPG
jgi:hypothetical protein